MGVFCRKSSFGLTLQRTTIVNIVAILETLKQHLKRHKVERNKAALRCFDSYWWFAAHICSTSVRVSLHAAGEAAAEVEAVQRVALLRGAGPGRRQTGDLAAQPVPPLQVQRPVVPRLLPADEAGVV